MGRFVTLLAIIFLCNVSPAAATPTDGTAPPPGSGGPEQGSEPAPQGTPQQSPQQGNQERAPDNNFWSDDRRSGAQSADMYAESSDVEFSVTGEDYLRGSQPYGPAIGRLFAYSEVAGETWCSASVVARNMVLTAGHCVFSREFGVDYDYFSFFPGQYGEINPYGQWSGGVSYFWPEYTTTYQEASWPYDYAIVAFPPREEDGQSIGDVVGWYPILANYPQDGQYYSIGYPSGGSFGANCQAESCWAYYCWSPLGASEAFEGGWYTVGFGCHTHKGASGGPVFKQYGDTWYVVSVNSMMNEPATGEERLYNVWGPYFNDWTISLYNYALEDSGQG